MLMINILLSYFLGNAQTLKNFYRAPWAASALPGMGWGVEEDLRIEDKDILDE